MGGSAAAGNATAAAEFNVWHDPEAAAIVFQSGVPISMYGLDVFMRPTIGRDEATKMSKSDKPTSQFAGSLALGINSRFVETSSTPNGVAHIWVDGAGENRIIIIPGANHEIEINKAIEAINAIADLAIVVAQCEIKQEVTVAAMHPDINLLGITCVDGKTSC